MIETKHARELSPAEWAAFAMSDVAYVKAVMNKGTVAYAVHGADGRPLAVIADRESAFAAVRQHDLEPMSVH